MMTAQSGNVISGTIQSARAPTPLSIITSLTSTERDIRGRSLPFFFFFSPSPPPQDSCQTSGRRRSLKTAAAAAAAHRSRCSNSVCHTCQPLVTALWAPIADCLAHLLLSWLTPLLRDGALGLCTSAHSTADPSLTPRSFIPMSVKNYGRKKNSIRREFNRRGARTRGI